MSIQLHRGRPEYRISHLYDCLAQVHLGLQALRAMSY